MSCGSAALHIVHVNQRNQFSKPVHLEIWKIQHLCHGGLRSVEILVMQNSWSKHQLTCCYGYCYFQIFPIIKTASESQNKWCDNFSRNTIPRNWFNNTYMYSLHLYSNNVIIIIIIIFYHNDFFFKFKYKCKLCTDFVAINFLQFIQSKYWPDMHY